MENRKIGFIGGGNMARAIISGLIKQFPPNNIYVADPELEKQQYFSEQLKIHAHADFSEFIDQVDIIILAIKPQGFPNLIQTLKSKISSDILVISIAAGVPIATIEDAFTINQLPIVRVMPNTPATVGMGASALFANPFVKDSQKSITELIFNSCGLAVWLDKEEEISAVIAVSGSSPAYFFYLMEIMTHVGIELGLSPKNSEMLTKQAMLGSAYFSQQSKDSLETLKKNVMSPQGTTEQAIFSLERNNLHDLIKDAMIAAFDRDKTLSKEIADQIKASNK